MKVGSHSLLYNNSFTSRASSSRKIKFQKTNLAEVFSRIPKEILENSEEIRKIKFNEKKPFYDIINLDKKPAELRISNSISEKQQENIENLKLFRDNFYEFNQEKKSLLRNFSTIKRENDKFSTDYYRMLKLKNKFKTGTYLDHDYLIPIANRYSQRGIKIPKINSEKSVFSGNPLILSGSELENFIVYNLGDRKKGTNFLKRLEDFVEKKETGMILPSDLKKMEEEAENPENLKGYVPPEILIPQLQNDINVSKNTLDNIDNLDNFFKFNDKNNIIKIKKNLPLISKFKLNLNNDINKNNINNNNLSLNLSHKITSANSIKHFSIKSKDKPDLFIFSRLPSSNKNNKRNKNYISLMNNLIFNSNDEKRRKSNYLEMNFLLKKIKGRFSSVSLKDNKSFLENNSADSKKIFSRKMLNLDNITKDSKYENIIESNSDENSDSLNILNEFEPKKNIKLQKEDEINSKKIEDMFNIVLKDKNLDLNKKNVQNFLSERGYDTSKIVDNEQMIKNIQKVESGIQKNLLFEGYKIRGNSFISENKDKDIILQKDKLFSKQIEENNNKFKKIIFEKNIEKDYDDDFYY